MRKTRKPYITFRSLSLFRIISQFYILSRKNAENAKYAETICPFSQSFVLSHFFAIIYFIAKGRGIHEIRGKHMSIFAVLSCFRFFSQSYILSRKDAEYAKYAENICPFSQSFRAFAFFRNHIFYRERTRNTRKPYITFRNLSCFRIFSQSYIYRERTRNTRNTRKPYITFRSLSLFRIFSQFYILSRKDAET